jgi:hypothetical protein
LKKLLLLYCISLFYSCKEGKQEVKKCEILYTSEIPPYKLVKKKCPAPAGIYLYPVYLYKGSEYIAAQVWSKKDTCSEGYQVANDLYVVLNVCEKTAAEIRPDKSTIDLKDVDSIQVHAVLQKQTKTLSEKQSKRFIEDWNKSTAHGFREDSVDLVFFPTNEYELTAYMKSGNKKFLASNYLVSERTHWVYFITGKQSEGYFKKLWEE